MPMPLPNGRGALAVCVSLLGCNRISTPASGGTARFSSANPFASASPLLYQAPQFDRIHDGDYQPAVEEGMRQQLVEIAAIAGDTATPSFDNTIVALERSGALLTRAFKVFNAMTQANTDDTLQRVQTDTTGAPISASTRCRGSWSSATTATSCAPARCWRSRTRRACAP